LLLYIELYIQKREREMKQAWLTIMTLMLSGCAMQVGEHNVLHPDQPGAAPPSSRLDSAPPWHLDALSLPTADAELHGVCGG